MIKKAILLLAVGIVLSVQSVGAQTTAQQVPAQVEQVQGIRQEAVRNIQEAKDDLLEQSRSLRQNFQVQSDSIREGLQNSLQVIQQNTDLTPEEARDAASQVRIEARETIQTRVEEIKQEITANREQFREQLEARKEEAQALIQQNREALAERVKSIQDERKQTVVINLSEKIDELNARYMDHLTSAINNIEAVLQGVISRTEKAAVDGKDVSGVRGAIAEAEEDIATARSYVIGQSATTYVIDDNLIEESLRSEISRVRDVFKSDLQAVKDEVMRARESVSDAAMLLGRIQGINNLDIEQ